MKGKKHTNLRSSFISDSSLILESYREIRTNIEHINFDKDIKSILVTSTKEGEGKTSVVSNLAMAFANTNKKVLIIDCNFKNPSIYKKFELKDRIGLTDILNNGIDYKDCICKSKISNLDILTTGKLELNSSEIFSQNIVKEFINKMKLTYDYIFIDTPSIGSSIDAGIMAGYTDGIIVVISPNRINNYELKVCEKRLKNVKANIIGMIFNKYNNKVFKEVDYICYH